MNRRGFFSYIPTMGIGLVYIRTLSGCGPVENHDDSQVLAESPTVTMQDIRMEGWSTLGSGFLGENGILKATQIRDNQPLDLPYVQDPHGHRFALTKEHLLALRQGQSVKVLTTEAQGHRHEVRIDPKRVVAGSAAVTMPVNPDDPGAPELFAMLTEADSPDLYVSSDESLAAVRLDYCVETATSTCDSGSPGWQDLEFKQTKDRRSFFKGLNPLNLGSTDAAELKMFLREKNNPARKLPLKLLRR